jgi:hypothetical protein
VSTNYTCAKEEGIYPICGQDSNEADPDINERLCQACLDPSTRPQHANGGTWRDGAGYKSCCGDDAGEGGFPYTTTTSGPISAHRASEATTPVAGSFPVGSLKETVCDDYYGASYDSSKQIDNDCDNQPNCKDSDCYTPTGRLPKVGPEKGYCCGGTSDDSNCVQAFESHLTGALATCGTNNECSCTDISFISPEICSSGSPCEVLYSQLTSASGFTTCIAMTGPQQKYVQFTGWPSGTSSITITVQAKKKTHLGEDCDASICEDSRCDSIETGGIEKGLSPSTVINFKALSSSVDCVIIIKKKST